jgi:hypothetical protein
MRIFLLVVSMFFALSASGEVSDSHRKATTELLELMEVERSMVGGATTMTDVMLQQNPTLVPFRDVLITWAEKTMTWERFEGKVVAMYAGAFSEAEIRDLIAFYQTPTGKKMIQLGPQLTQQGAQLGAQVARENEDELMRMLEKRAAELAPEPATPPPAQPPAQ